MLKKLGLFVVALGLLSACAGNVSTEPAASPGKWSKSLQDKMTSDCLEGLKNGDVSEQAIKKNMAVICGCVTDRIQELVPHELMREIDKQGNKHAHFEDFLMKVSVTSVECTQQILDTEEAQKEKTKSKPQ